MGKPAARVGDMHVCPMVDGVKPHVGGPVMPAGVPTVLIGGMPAATVGSLCTCASAPDTILMGSAGVMIGGMPAARMGDTTAHGGSIILGCFTVLIGEAGGGGGGGGGAAGGMAQKMPVKQAKDADNAKNLKQAAKENKEAADKKQKEDYKAKFSLTDDAGKAVAKARYQIQTSDGALHDGKTNSNGETSEIAGYTAADCKVTFLNS